MINHPLNGDWIHLVNNDVNNINIDDNPITKLGKSQFKNIVKTKIRHYAIKKLEKLKQTLKVVEYNYIVGHIEGQSKVTKVYQAIINLRERLRQGKIQKVAYPGSNSGSGGKHFNYLQGNILSLQVNMISWRRR